MAAAAREFPDAPRVGVGAVVLDGPRVLLARRGRPPSQGKWSIPGGLVHLGERIEDALVREIEEESGLHIRVLGLCGVIDRVVREGDAVRYHYVIIDYVAEAVGGRLQAGSDAAEVRWVTVDDLGQYDTTDGLADMVYRARAIKEAASSPSGGSIR
jgi:ADP-ribose pyrophosphatase YjhB (NUDIX family)